MSRISKTFTRFSTAVARWTGRPMVFITCCALVVLWAVSGPLFGFSDTWQLVINTSTTIITFLMVFLIQNSQNRDSAAIQVKLDELIRASAAQNRFIGIEQLSEEELKKLQDSPFGKRMAELKAAGEHAKGRAQAKAEEAADDAA